VPLLLHPMIYVPSTDCSDDMYLLASKHAMHVGGIQIMHGLMYVHATDWKESDGIPR
jgi:hypothetical protein